MHSQKTKNPFFEVLPLILILTGSLMLTFSLRLMNPGAIKNLDKVLDTTKVGDGTNIFLKGGGMIINGTPLTIPQQNNKLFYWGLVFFLVGSFWEITKVFKHHLAAHKELMEKRIKAGVGTIIVKDGKILFGKRKNVQGNGSWNFPGGHLEFNESWEECAIRETMEETSLKIKNIRFATATNDISPVEGTHYVTIFMIADYDSGELKNMEPEKCECWGWFNWDNPPQPLFISEQNLLKQGYNPFAKQAS